MSNPFRRDMTATAAASDAAFEERFPAMLDVQPSAPKRKQVQFRDATPEATSHNPYDDLALDSPGAAMQGDIPRQDGVREQDSEDDLSEPEEAGVSYKYGPRMQMDANAAAPPNPFARTLATIDPESSTDMRQEADKHSDHTKKEDDSRKPSMGVDAFTQMLLTGKIASQSAPQPQRSQEAINGSEPPIHQAQEPRRMHNPEASQEPVSSTISDRASKPKPPPPRHRHGKGITSPTATSPGPQTVSFDDFSASMGAAIPTSPSAQSSHRSSMHLHNKPLPPPPPPSTHHGKAVTPPSGSEESIDVRPNPVKRPSISGTSMRRDSYLRHEITDTSASIPTNALATRERSDTTSSITTQDAATSEGVRRAPSISDSSTPPPSIGKAAGPSKVPPPPPPARRSGAMGTVPHLQRQASSSSASNIQIQRSGSSSSSRPGPPPPARDRSISQVSQLSNAGSEASHSTTTTAAIPPPPPPRRTSSRSSIEVRRTSGELRRSSMENSQQRRLSTESQKRPSVASTRSRKEPIAEDATENDIRPLNVEDAEGEGLRRSESRSSKDIMADMDAFQREIDALISHPGAPSKEKG